MSEKEVETTQDQAASEAPTKPITVHIGNISFDTKEEKIREKFSQFGTLVSVKVPSGENERNRGFAFVEYNTEGEAQAAIKDMNGVELDGRKIEVDLSKPRERRPRDDYDRRDRYRDDYDRRDRYRDDYDPRDRYGGDYDRRDRYRDDYDLYRRDRYRDDMYRRDRYDDNDRRGRYRDSNYY